MKKTTLILFFLMLIVCYASAQVKVFNSKMNVGTLDTARERLDVRGGVLIGNTTGTLDGTIRYTGSDIEGRIGGQYKSLTRQTECNLAEKADSIVIAGSDTTTYNFVVNGNCEYDVVITKKGAQDIANIVKYTDSIECTTLCTDTTGYALIIGVSGTTTLSDGFMINGVPATFSAGANFSDNGGGNITLSPSGDNLTYSAYALSNEIISCGEGYIEIPISTANQYIYAYFGLTSNTSPPLGGMELGARFRNANNGFAIRDNGSNFLLPAVPTLSVGDVVRIQISNYQPILKINGTEVYSYTTTLNPNSSFSGVNTGYAGSTQVVKKPILEVLEDACTLGGVLGSSGDSDWNFEDANTLSTTAERLIVGQNSFSQTGAFFEVPNKVYLTDNGLNGNTGFFFGQIADWSTEHGNAAYNLANNFHYWTDGNNQVSRVEFENNTAEMQFYIEGIGSAWYGLQNGSNHLWSYGFDTSLYGNDFVWDTGFDIDNASVMRLTPAGDLRVAGNFVSAGVTLNTPDYVFDKKYKLPSISAQKRFVEKHKHLPSMKSATYMEKEGNYSLEKYMKENREELEKAMLYIFQLEERIRELER